MFGYASQATMTMALKFVSATAAMGISYVQIVWAVILGYFVFHEVGHVQNQCYMMAEGLFS